MIQRETYKHSNLECDGTIPFNVCDVKGLTETKLMFKKELHRIYLKCFEIGINPYKIFNPCEVVFNGDEPEYI